MKQHLTPQDLDQLTPAGKDKLRDWCCEHLDYSSATSWGSNRRQILADGTICYFDDKAMDEDETMPIALLSIGQMIKFLYDHNVTISLLNSDTKQVSTTPNGHWNALLFYEGGAHASQRNELTEILWSACVEVLNKERNT